MIKINENKLIHILRKLNPQSTYSEYSEMLSQQKKPINFENNSEMIDQIKHFMGKHHDHFKDHLFNINIVEEQKENLSMSDLNYIFYKNENVKTEWVAINQFYIQYLSGDITSASKIFFCFENTSFGDMESFIFRSTSMDIGLPHMIIGFGNLKSNVQKEVLDCFRRRFVKEEKQAYIVMFLNSKDRSNRLILENYRDCLSCLDLKGAQWEEFEKKLSRKKNVKGKGNI
jgi:hypothetical protein